MRKTTLCSIPYYKQLPVPSVWKTISKTKLEAYRRELVSDRQIPKSGATLVAYMEDGGFKIAAVSFAAPYNNKKYGFIKDIDGMFEITRLAPQKALSEDTWKTLMNSL